MKDLLAGKRAGKNTRLCVLKLVQAPTTATYVDQRSISDYILNFKENVYYLQNLSE